LRTTSPSTTTWLSASASGWTMYMPAAGMPGMAEHLHLDAEDLPALVDELALEHERQVDDLGGARLERGEDLAHVAGLGAAWGSAASRSRTRAGRAAGDPSAANGAGARACRAAAGGGEGVRGHAASIHRPSRGAGEAARPR
jgi:hypothetical protein